MDFLRADSWATALQIKSERHDAVALGGGTDLMVELNFDRRRPPALLDLTRISELTEWQYADGIVRIGAGVPFGRIIDEVGALAPGLVMASRTIGSPQIRNRATLGGNLGTASPAGDALPPLVAGDAVVEVASVRGERALPIEKFILGPKRNDLAPDELIRAVALPAGDGPQQFAKVGTRNAMVIAVCSFALNLHPSRRTVGTCIGSAGPTPIRATEAAALLEAELDGRGLWQSAAAIDSAVIDRFGELAGQQARPIDDVRGTASYRRHAISVLARRTLRWAWSDYRKAHGCSSNWS
jgi:CO/xanthine dehydrogenase FAD-binding subunit